LAEQSSAKQACCGHECDDGESYRFLLALSLKLCAMHALLAGN
jgi:hypothetical protein